MCRHISLLVLLWRIGLSSQYEIINDFNSMLRAQPKLECLSDGMRLHLNPAIPFGGHVYVKGYFQTPKNCHLNYCKSPVASPFYIHIPYQGDCLVSSQRLSNPPGINHQVTIVVQHHHHFVTAGDRAYRLNCFYEERSMTLKQQVNIKEMQPTNLDGHTGARCHYDVLSGHIDGPKIQLASIGDPVVHRWTCDSEDTGFLVHSCVVKDQAGKDFPLIDERGCALDPGLVPPLEYSPDFRTVHTTINAFRFADQLMVHFSCQLTLCEKHANGCEGIVPPTCNPIPLNAPLKTTFRNSNGKLEGSEAEFSTDTKRPEENRGEIGAIGAIVPHPAEIYVAPSITTREPQKQINSKEKMEEISWTDQVAAGDSQRLSAIQDNNQGHRDGSTALRPAHLFPQNREEKGDDRDKEYLSKLDPIGPDSDPLEPTYSDVGKQRFEESNDRPRFPTPSTLSTTRTIETTLSLDHRAVTSYPDTYSDYFTTQRIPTGFRYFLPKENERDSTRTPLHSWADSDYTTPFPLPLRIDPNELRRLLKMERQRNTNEFRLNEPNERELYQTIGASNLDNTHGGLDYGNHENQKHRITQDFGTYSQSRHPRMIDGESEKEKLNDLINEYEHFGENDSLVTTTIKARGMLNDSWSEAEGHRQPRNSQEKSRNITVDVTSGQMIILSSEEGFPRAKLRREISSSSNENVQIDTIPTGGSQSACAHLLLPQFFATLLFTLLQLATLSIIYIQRRRYRALQAKALSVY